MKRWLSHAFIAAYLSALTFGVAAHTLSFGANVHPVMYYLVWDMFCGWGSYANRMEIIAEGESGEYYRVAPAPWGTIQPFGKLDRRHYDPSGVATYRMAKNVLDHTEHEPITRIYVIEENWAKKYNLPNRIWSKYYEEPNDPQSYFFVRTVFTNDGQLVTHNGTWFGTHLGRMLVDNPRLQAERQVSKPMYAISPQSFSQPPGATFQPGNLNGIPSNRSDSSPLGN